MKNFLFLILFIPLFCLSQKQKVNANFEDGDPLAGGDLKVSNGTCLTGKCATVSSLFPRTGTKSLRFEVDSSDAFIFGAVRNEVFTAKDSTTEFRFVQFSTLVNNYINDGKNMLVWQMKQGYTPTYADNLPPLSLWIQNGRWIFWIQFDSVDVGLNTHLVQRSYDLGPIRSNMHEDFIFEIKQSIGYDGYVRFYKNGYPLAVKRFAGSDYIYTVQGANTNKQYGRRQPFHYFRFGPYCFGKFGIWSNRVFYFDNIRIVDAGYTIQDLLPAVDVNPKKVKGYKFLNSSQL